MKKHLDAEQLISEWPPRVDLVDYSSGESLWACLVVLS